MMINILQDIEKIFTAASNDSISPSELVQSLQQKDYSHKEIQNTIHNEIDLGHIELGTGLRLKKATKCMFDDLPKFNHYGGKIVYMLSCPCPKCTPYC